MILYDVKTRDSLEPVSLSWFIINRRLVNKPMTVTITSLFFTGNDYRLEKVITRSNLKSDIKWKLSIFSIGPFWPTHILERIRAAMNLLEYCRQDFFYGTKWNKVHTDLTTYKWMIGHWPLRLPFTLFSRRNHVHYRFAMSHIFF